MIRSNCLLNFQLLQSFHLLFPYWNFSVGQVSFCMFRQVIASHELPQANWTGVFLLSGVGSAMASEFI